MVARRFRPRARLIRPILTVVLAIGLGLVALSGAVESILAGRSDHAIVSSGGGLTGSVGFRPRISPTGELARVTPEDRRIAVERLRARPLLPEAIWFLQRPLGNPDMGDLPVLLLAEKVSRRDIPTQMALIKARALANDPRGSFVHIDRVLRVADTGTLPLLTTLAQGIDDPRFQGLLANYADRPWLKGVLEIAYAKSADPLHVIEFLQSAHVPRETALTANLAQLLDRTVVAGQFPAAERFARSMGWSAQAGPAGFDFSAASTDSRFGMLAWRPQSDQNLNTEFATPQTTRVDVFPGRSGPFLSRATAFPEGAYTFSTQTRLLSAVTGPGLRWVMYCGIGNSATQSWEATIPLSNQNGSFAAPLAIRAGCAVQYWVATASNLDSQLDARIELDKLRLTRTG